MAPLFLGFPPPFFSPLSGGVPVVLVCWGWAPFGAGGVAFLVALVWGLGFGLSPPLSAFRVREV